MVYDQLSFLSDHDLIFCSLSINLIPINVPIYFTYRDYKPIGHESLFNGLAAIEWHDVWFVSTVENINFCYTFDRHVPLWTAYVRLVGVGKNSVWQCDIDTNVLNDHFTIISHKRAWTIFDRSTLYIPLLCSCERTWCCSKYLFHKNMPNSTGEDNKPIKFIKLVLPSKTYN